MKKILFVINTLGGAGAETALVELLNSLDKTKYDISLYVLMGQGELVDRIPEHVCLLNRKFSSSSVLSKEGRRNMIGAVLKAFWRNGHMAGKTAYAFRTFLEMKRNGNVQPDKILWRVMAKGGERFSEHYDLAVAYLEGGAAYYVADEVSAKRKAAFIHIDYESSGYTKKMDRDCYEKMDRIFTVSDEVRDHFLHVYPEYADKTKVFHNIINQEKIRQEALKEGGFPDSGDEIKILTVGRLTYQKAYDIAIEALDIVKKAGYHAKWYVLGEGDQRAALEKRIAQFGLEEDFLLAGAERNPFPWYKKTDLYVHATRFEGKSIAIQEAQTLGCAIIASDCNGNREQIVPDVDGMLCELTPQGIAECIIELIENPEKRERLSREAAKKQIVHREEMKQLLELAEGLGEDEK